MMSNNYFVYGINLKSNVCFPEFSDSCSGDTDIEFFLKPSQPDGVGELPQEQCILNGVYDTAEGTREAFGLYGFDSHYVLRWRLLADFVVYRDGSLVTCHPWKDVSWEEDARPFFLGRVLPLALNLKGKLTLHSSSVLLPHGAVAFLATSGTGKSTLATALACQGYPFIADDVLVVANNDTGIEVSPGSAQVRLTDESLNFLTPHLPAKLEARPDYDKTRVSLSANGDGIKQESAYPLKSIYIIERRPEDISDKNICISELEPKEALPVLLNYLTNTVLFEIPQLNQQFSFLAQLVMHVPVKRIEYPSDLGLLSNVCEAVFNDQNLQVGIAG